ncbi:hypothetical protein GCM10011410_21870 [Hoyosella rhizosphaerae]|uniref:Uncharacterized protein n=1 Tax=Hoyosella rhizosphaerae TaxID=1755582 RepID=A0A916UDX6_9ACTN|nr:hypothetical protein GCM10011410_21870 [Hoyosella rhizosphaerae]
MPNVAIDIVGPGYSVCHINRSHNRSGGADPSWLHTSNKVIEDDPFYVDADFGYLPNDRNETR